MGRGRSTRAPRRRARPLVAALLALAVPLAGSAGPSAAGPERVAAAAATPGSFELVGHDALMNRGMNAAIAIHGNYAYIGSRTDGTHPNAGVMIVDISDPANPQVVGQIGPPEEGNPGETSRELRVWPEKNLLIVLNLASNCSPLIHGCSPQQATMDDNYRFYDISGDNATAPKLVSEYVPSEDPHEFYLWDDPKRPGRALIYQSTPAGDDQLLVTDISKASAGKFKELAKWKIVIPNPDTDNRLHSLSISPNGRRGYVAYLGGGFLIINTADFAAAKRRPKVRLITPVQNRPHWGDPGIHSAVPFFGRRGRRFVLATDEVYGKLGGVLAEHGCPWGWTRILKIRNPKRPRVIAHYKVKPYNLKSYCDEVSEDRDNNSSFSAHNPTLTKSVALITWHSGGLQAVSLRRPRRPKQLAEYLPEPEPVVAMEDPALSSGRDKVVMWSYPIIKDGLIYVVDVRNGLYILRYKGPFKRQIARFKFLEGNSNLAKR